MLRRVGCDPNLIPLLTLQIHNERQGFRLGLGDHGNDKCENGEKGRRKHAKSQTCVTHITSKRPEVTALAVYAAIACVPPALLRETNPASRPYSSTVSRRCPVMRSTSRALWPSRKSSTMRCCCSTVSVFMVATLPIGGRDPANPVRF